MAIDDETSERIAQTVQELLKDPDSMNSDQLLNEERLEEIFDKI